MLGSPGDASWEVLGARVGPSGALGEVLEEARARLEGPRGVLEIEFGDPELMREGQNVIKTMLF